MVGPARHSHCQIRSRLNSESVGELRSEYDGIGIGEEFEWIANVSVLPSHLEVVGSSFREKVDANNMQGKTSGVLGNDSHCFADHRRSFTYSRHVSNSVDEVLGNSP